MQIFSASSARTVPDLKTDTTYVYILRCRKQAKEKTTIVLPSCLLKQKIGIVYFQKPNYY